MAYALAFLISSQDAIKAGCNSWDDLCNIQSGSLTSASALRIFNTPQEWDGHLKHLFDSGAIKRSGDVCGEINKLCDAVIPNFAPADHWLSVYILTTAEKKQMKTKGKASVMNTIDRRELRDSHERLPGMSSDQCVSTVQLLDEVPLIRIENETCWFYPTEQGVFLSWTSQMKIIYNPGHLSEQIWQKCRPEYSRQELRLLWTLMADDTTLTCVGLTYGGRRIEWLKAESSVPEDITWSAFEINNSREKVFQHLDTLTLGTNLKSAT